MASQEAPSASLLEGQSAPSYGASEAGPSAPRPATPPPRFAALAAEFLGTCVLVFTVGCAVAGPAPAAWAATAIASVLMVMIYATGPVSGGNLNPAVSLALAISGKLPWLHMLYYWLAQMLGALVAVGIYRLIVFPRAVRVAPIKPFDVGHACAGELIYTFMLCFVVLSCAASRKNNPPKDPNQFFALAIGFVIVAGGYAVGGISGAAFNPAVALGLGCTSGQSPAWAFLWTLVEFVGAALAAGVFRLLRREEFQTPELTEGELAEHKPDLATRCGAEFLGTFMLVLTVGLNLVVNSPSTAFSAAAALMCMIYSLGNISGAHLNPAVTMAVVVSGRGKCAIVDALCYMLSQLLAGISAALVYSVFHAASLAKNKSIMLAPGKRYAVAQGMLAEGAATLVLAYVVLAVATVRVPKEWKTKQNFTFGLAIASCVTAGGFAMGSVSGGELNPAVALGIAVENHVHPGRAGAASFGYCAAFMFSELVGGILAAGLFRVTHPGEYEDAQEVKNEDAEAKNEDAEAGEAGVSGS